MNIRTRLDKLVLVCTVNKTVQDMTDAELEQVISKFLVVKKGEQITNEMLANFIVAIN